MTGERRPLVKPKLGAPELSSCLCYELQSNCGGAGRSPRDDAEAAVLERSVWWVEAGGDDAVTNAPPLKEEVRGVLRGDAEGGERDASKRRELVVDANRVANAFENRDLGDEI